MKAPKFKYKRPARQIGTKPVVAATRPITIHITAEDVKKADRKAPDRCAAALACKRLPNALNARVHSSRVYVETPSNWVVFHTPESLHREIVAFDRGGEFFPGDYTLRIAPPSEDPVVRRRYQLKSAEEKAMAAKRQKAWDRKNPGLATIRKMPRKLRLVQGIRNRFNTK